MIVNGNGSLMVGDKIVLNVPENPRLHRAEATIRILTNYGAIVFCAAAATKQFRATFEEMSQLPCEEKQHIRTKLMGLVEQGFTGDVCSACGSFRMRRTGTCSTCEDCGTTSGCG